MFLSVIIFLLLLSVTAEWYLYRSHIRHLSRSIRYGYFALLAIAIVPYFALMIVGRFYDISSPATASLSSIGIIAFIINFICKACWVGISFSSSKRVRTCLLCFGVICSLLILYGTFGERFQLRTTHVEIAFDNLPDGADGLRVAQISDIHIGQLRNRHTILRKVAGEIAAQSPDIVIDCGDMVNGRYTELDSVAMDILSHIEAPLGTYTTLGNHDKGIYILDTVDLPRDENIRLLKECQAVMGWKNIVNSTTPLICNGDTLYLTALDYPTDLKKGSHGKATDEEYSEIFAPLPQDAFNIVIAHTPIVWDNILSATEAELTLSGHVHAMQLRLPPITKGGRGWSPAALIYPHWSGLYREGNCALHISDGVGGGIPIRIGVRPQLVIITLRKS